MDQLHLCASYNIFDWPAVGRASRSISVVLVQLDFVDLDSHFNSDGIYVVVALLHSDSLKMDMISVVFWFDPLIAPVRVLCQVRRHCEVLESIPTASMGSWSAVMYSSNGDKMVKVLDDRLSIYIGSGVLKEPEPGSDRETYYYQPKYNQKKLLLAHE